MSNNLPYTNADIRPKSKIIHNMKHAVIPSFNAYAAHALQSMSTSAKLLLGSIAACINGIIPRAFKYTAQSIMLNDVIVSFDEEKIE